MVLNDSYKLCSYMSTFYVMYMYTVDSQYFYTGVTPEISERDDCTHNSGKKGEGTMQKFQKNAFSVINFFYQLLQMGGGVVVRPCWSLP